MNTILGYLRQVGTAIRFLVLTTLLLGVVYPLAIFGIGQVLAPAQANGSIVVDPTGQPAASALIVQTSADSKGVQDPKWFHARPSALTWNPSSSSATNLGPNDPGLLRSVQDNRAAIAAAEHVDPSGVPADALTASGSGLDPQISVAYAELQIPRVAAAHELSQDTVRSLMARNTTDGLEAFLGQPSVNVTILNLDIAAASRAGTR
jgi:K+-transporting ATPase ATPase C chain